MATFRVLIRFSRPIFYPALCTDTVYTQREHKLLHLFIITPFFPPFPFQRSEYDNKKKTDIDQPGCHDETINMPTPQLLLVIFIDYHRKTPDWMLEEDGKNVCNREKSSYSSTLGKFAATESIFPFCIGLQSICFKYTLAAPKGETFVLLFNAIAWNRRWTAARLTCRSDGPHTYYTRPFRLTRRNRIEGRHQNLERRTFKGRVLGFAYSVSVYFLKSCATSGKGTS